MGLSSEVGLNLNSYEKPNLYLPDQGLNVYDPSPSHIIKIRCPHCQVLGTFPAFCRGVGYIKYFANTSKSQADGVFAFIRVCPNPTCGGLVFTISGAGDRVTVHPPELLDFNAESLPEALIITLKEALVCHSVGAHRAATMMVRRLLEELCDDCEATGKTLHDRLKALRTQITLPEDLFSAMDELKSLGNDAAHIDAKAYLHIDKEEAELSIMLAQEILKARYQHKTLLDRLRARKASGES